MRSFDLLASLAEAQQQAPQGSAGTPMRLGVVDPAYVAGSAALVLPRVRFEGEDELGERTYACLAPYVPAANDRVLMIPTGTTYTIVGKVSAETARPVRTPEVQIGKHSATMGVAAAAYTSAIIPFPVPYPVGVTPVMPQPNIESASGTENYLYARARSITNTGFQITVFKSDAARADFTLAAVPIHWVAYYQP